MGVRQVKVLYIMGSGRSGSTLLDLILGEIDGFFSTGELSSLWNRGLQIEDWQCGCGLRLVHCPFWEDVLERVDLRETPEEIVDWQRRIIRERYTWKLLSTRQAGRSWPEKNRYVSVVQRLYEAVAATSGARVIIDSSKTPTDAALLPTIPGLDPYYIHLVRDPRAAVHSWRRIRDNEGAKTGRFADMGPLGTSSRWVARSLGAEMLRRRRGRSNSLLIRYEDLVASPTQVMESVIELVGEKVEPPALHNNTVTLNGNHTASGNRIRFRKGEMNLRIDSDWEKVQPRVDRMIASAVTFPFLLRYNYPILISRRSRVDRP